MAARNRGFRFLTSKFASAVGRPVYGRTTHQVGQVIAVEYQATPSPDYHGRVFFCVRWSSGQIETLEYGGVGDLDWEIEKVQARLATLLTARELALSF